MIRKNIKHIWTFLKGCKFYYLVGLVVSALSYLAEMIDPQIIKVAIDNALGGKPSELPEFINKLIYKYFGSFEYLGQHLYIFAIAILVSALFKVLTEYCRRVINSRAAEKLHYNMTTILFDHIQHLPYKWHMQHHTGDIIQRCITDVNTVRAFISDQLFSIIRVVIMTAISLFFMFSMNVKMTFIALIPIPFMLFFVFTYGRKMESGFRTCDVKEAEVTAVLQENLSGVRVVRAFGQERKELDNFLKINGEYTGLFEKLAALFAKFFFTQNFIESFQIALVIIVGCIMCVHGEITSGEYIAFVSYNAILANPLRRLGRVISEMTKAGVSLDRIAEVLDAEVEKDADGAKEVPLDKEIEFKNINFAYEKDPVLKDVSFKIEPGTTLGILGGTGSGKSSLMLLLDKLYDLKEGEGNIYIGGTDIKNIKTSYLRKNISIVLQEPFMFSRTIKDNIAITDRRTSLNKVRDAAKSAYLDETVMGLTNQYETMLGERGVTLSGGQKQRAAIARALVFDKPILIFDDSLSAVDTQTDALIRAELARHFGKATVILISHRITTLSKADKILVLDKGRIAEFGSPAELECSGGMYQQIFEMQSGRKEESHV